jgi:aryl-alcohol dehydrogenase-like predicted oxidoreductase
MEYRPLGRTGVQVSKLCLGTMMFGAWGNTDHDDSIRIIHTALDAGVNFIDTADVYSAGESEEIIGKAPEGAPRRRRPGHEVLHADGRRPQPTWGLPALDHH